MSTRYLLSRQIRLILAITLAHIVAWFAYYSQIPAGLYPGTEARATLDAALALAQGTPTSGSGHSLYTYSLSLLAHFFSDSSSLTFAARGLNALAFILAAGLWAATAAHYWRRSRAVWISGLLVGLNPFLVFWAGEVSPALLATACISAALWRVQPWLRHPKLSESVWIGLSLALAALFETTLLPIALLWPALACLYPQRERALHLVLALIPIVATCALVAVSSLQIQDAIEINTQQLGSGLYSALGSQESYGGKSFSLYKQLHVLLFLNPIHWGALFILAGAGIYARLKDGHRGHSLLLAVIVLALFALSFALLASGSQARASMIPLLAVFAAGIQLIPKIWKHASPRTRRRITIGGLLLALFSYAGYFGPPQSQTWERDYVFLAEANIRLGNNERANTWAEKALELNPARGDMQEVLVIAQFNNWAIGDWQRLLPIEAAREYLHAAQQLENTPTTQAIKGIYLYKLREVEAADALWQAQRAESALALLCLYWTGSVTEVSHSEIRAHQGTRYVELLKTAAEINRSALEYGNAERQLDNILAFAY